MCGIRRIVMLGTIVSVLIGFQLFRTSEALNASILDNAESGGLKVQVSVIATDPNGRQLKYRWRSTDGTIADVNSPTTSWTVTNGPGLHFAYVLVSNGAGGYTERRAVINTDLIGAPTVDLESNPYQAPPAQLPVGETYRTFVASGAADPNFFTSLPNVPDVTLFLHDSAQSVLFPGTGVAVSDLRGQVIIPNMLPVSTADPLQFSCKLGPLSIFTLCGNFVFDNGAAFSVPSNVAVTDYFIRPHMGGTPDSPVIGGTVRLADGSPCGTVNEFFGVKATGTAHLVDAKGNKIGTTSRLSTEGEYLLPYSQNVTTVVLRCKSAAPQRIAIVTSGRLPQSSFASTGQPFVSDMTITLNGTTVGGLLPPPSGVPSDVTPDPERFLSYKGIDSRQDACAYYRAIGAAQGCEDNGQLINPINFDDWMRSVRIGKYALTGAVEYSASYINKADLNLARNHHSISYGSNQTAAYVCNHLGPKVLDPDQAEIDSVIDNLSQGKNLVACVAMDYSASAGVNNGAPFVRFLIFGPNGQLLPSVNLDGRREKFVPGTCVACHGGDHYAGRFLADGRADVGAHFLPYDPGNFEFSSKPGLTEADQEGQLFALNQNVLMAGPTVAAQELIAGWYTGGTAVDKSYLPPSWRGRDQLTTEFYLKVVAKSCRGCHVNLPAYNWDHYDNMVSTPYRHTGPDFAYTVGCHGANSQFRSHSMPNSLVTFNRFWNSAGSTVDQPALLNAFNAQAIGGDDATLDCIP